MKKRILLFIPVFNCEKQIPRVISKIDRSIQDYINEVLIIDNRSYDHTLDAAVAASSALETKVTILRNTMNYNLGGSIKRAFLYALEHKYDYMITLHGDDQADIRDFLPMLEKETYRTNDLVIGARFHPNSTLKGYSWVRTLGNRVLNVMCSMINKQRVHDMIAGMNCFNLSFFKDKFFLKFPDNLTFDAHVLLYAFNKKASIAYLPITWREEDQISNAKVIKQALTILKLFSSYLLQREHVFSQHKSEKPEGFHYDSEIILQR